VTLVIFATVVRRRKLGIPDRFGPFWIGLAVAAVTLAGVPMTGAAIKPGPLVQLRDLGIDGDEQQRVHGPRRLLGWTHRWQPGRGVDLQCLPGAGGGGKNRERLTCWLHSQPCSF